MVYRFCIVSDEVDNFKREIAIDSDDTFLRLRNAILDSVGYSRDQLDSFFICDDDWTKEKEITLEEMDTDSSEDTWLMEDTPISELVEDEGQKLIYMFDYMTERSFFMEMKELLPHKTLRDPLCERKEGNPPKQFVDIEEVIKPNKIMTDPVDDLDADFYGAEGYNDDELDFQGYDDEAEP